MEIKNAIQYMSVEKAVELEKKRFFCNADETVNSISIYSMKKQIPIKPKVMDKQLENENIWWYCGACGASRHTGCRSNYCSYCGQRVDWSDYLKNSKYIVPDDIAKHATMEFPEMENN